jgi:hypothetical protein
MRRTNVKCQSSLNYTEFRTSLEPYMVYGKVQIKSNAQIEKGMILIFFTEWKNVLTFSHLIFGF